MTFSQGWSLYKTTINKTGTDGKPLTLVVYNLNKTKDLKNIPYDKFLEFKGEMLTNLGMKWGKFQKFEKWTYPPDTDILKVIIDKYYGAGESKKEETPTPQPAPKSNKMSVKEIADRLMTLDSTLWDRLKIESGSKLYSDDDLQKKYIKYWTEFYEGDTSIPTNMKELSMRERNELGDYFEDDNYHALKNLFMLYGYFGIDNKVSAELYYSTSGYGLNPKNFKSEDKKEIPFKEGDKFLMTRTGETFTIDFMVDDNYGIVYFDGLTGNLTKSALQVGLDSGYYKRVVDEEKKEYEFKKGDVFYSKLYKQKLTIDRVQEDTIFVDYEDDSSERYTPIYCRLMVQRGDWIKVIDEEKEEIPFKEGDKFSLTINSGDTTLTIIDVDIDSVKVKYADGSIGIFEINSAKSRIERGVWKKVLDEEIEGGTEEEIKKAIAALEILAEDGDEDAKKGIEALKILLN
jgi:hypothetical protein